METEEQPNLIQRIWNKINGKEVGSAFGEIGFGTGLDIATTPLLANPLLYGGVNFLGGAGANYVAQQARTEEDLEWYDRDWGEIISSGLLGIIPGMSAKAGKLTRLVGNPNTYRRAATFGAASGIGDQFIRQGINEQRLPTAGEIATGGITGGVAGPVFKKSFDEVAKIFTKYQGKSAKEINTLIQPEEGKHFSRHMSVLQKGILEANEAGDMTTVRRLLFDYRKAHQEGYSEYKSYDEFKQSASNLQANLYRKIVGPDQLKLFDLPLDPAGKEAFRVFSDNIAIKSGYESMSDFRKNVLNKWPEKDQVQLFRQLWEGQGEGYIEHLVAKGSHMDWYWNMKGVDRNSVDNVRILYNDNLKNLKDTVEKILYGTPGNPGLGWQGEDLKNRLIVSFEDPQRKTKKLYSRQNPGDIVIRRAGNDEIIGNLGQYLDTLYPQNPVLKKLFEEGVAKLGLTPAQFRKQILTERINIIIKNSNTLPKNATKRKRYIKQFIDDDMTDLIIQYPFLKPRKSITEAMDAIGSGVTEADYDLRSTKRASKIPPLGDERFTKGGPFKDVTKTEQFNPRQILLDLFGPEN